MRLLLGAVSVFIFWCLLVFKKFFIKVFCTRCMDDLDELGEGDSSRAVFGGGRVE
jgi:hypothetical protein